MATIRDVAKLAGVGLGTASRAISGKGVVSVATQRKVETAARTLNFLPSRVAQALSLKKQGLIGVFFPTFEGTYFAPILQTIENELRVHGLHMVTATYAGIGSRRERLLKGMEFLIERQCDGILVIDTYADDADIKALSKRVSCLVMLNRVVKGLKRDSFSVSHEQAGRLAARELIDRGHQKLAVMYSPRHSSDVNSRVTGFLREIANMKNCSAQEIRLEGLMTFENALKATEVLLTQGDIQFTGIFCASDVLAMTFMGRMQLEGIKIPEKISVLGYDDAELAAYTYPTLSTVRIPSQLMAVNACRHLLNRTLDFKLPVMRDFPPQIIARNSVQTIH